MKKILFLFFNFIWITSSFAKNTGLLWWAWKTVEDIRDWNIHIGDFPDMIRYMIDIFLALAWTVSLVFIIVWAYQIIFGSLSDNKTKWKDTIIMALAWFILAALSWFIVKLVLDNIN
jgi:hypothetical protein